MAVKNGPAMKSAMMKTLIPRIRSGVCGPARAFGVPYGG
jgi:hypothetical protein